MRVYTTTGIINSQYGNIQTLSPKLAELSPEKNKKLLRLKLKEKKQELKHKEESQTYAVTDIKNQLIGIFTQKQVEDFFSLTWHYIKNRYLNNGKRVHTFYYLQTQDKFNMQKKYEQHVKLK